MVNHPAQIDNSHDRSAGRAVSNLLKIFATMTLFFLRARVLRALVA